MEGARQITGRVVRTRKGAVRGLDRGLIYLEAYLPFDPVAFAELEGLALELAAKAGATAPDWTAAAAASPDLARRALDPIDAHGEAMLPQDLEQLAHGFLTDSRRVDVQHDQISRDTARVVQSFLNTPEIGSPHFFPGAWVVVVELDPGSPEWSAVEAGTINAVSFQAVVRKIPVVVRRPPSPTVTA